MPRHLPLLAVALALGCGACTDEEPFLESSPAVAHGEMTAHFVAPSSDDIVLRTMAYDMEARFFNYMGPEDVHLSSQLEGYPFVLITRNGPSGLPTVGGGLYEHEFTHMAAAKNVLDQNGALLANLMRPDGCAFTYRARFHEVCADWQRFVSPRYKSFEKMTQLLSVIEPIAPDFTRTDEFVGRVETTGIDLVDAACLWDLEALDILEDLYDEEEGAGAFEALFPPQEHHGSCVADHLELAEFEIVGPPPAECIQTTVFLNIRPAPTLDNIPFKALAPESALRITGEEVDADGIHWVGVTRPDLPCEDQGQDGQCWVSKSFTEACPAPPTPDAGVADAARAPVPDASVPSPDASRVP